jgi:hypothetical protein
MCSRSGKIKIFLVFLVDKQPVWLDVTFPIAAKVASKFVVFVFFWKRVMIFDGIYKVL